jgi:alpha-mannosidase
MNALAEYKNIERLLEYFNSKNNYNITIKMSTPSDYIAALKKENIKWPVKYEDGFPYASTDYEVWGGYFSSRPVAKKMTKDASAIINAENFIFSQRML